MLKILEPCYNLSYLSLPHPHPRSSQPSIWLSWSQFQHPRGTRRNMRNELSRDYNDGNCGGGGYNEEEENDDDDMMTNNTDY